MSQDKNNDSIIIKQLDELDLLRPYLNLSEIARRAGLHRANINRWWDSGADMLATPMRREFRQTLIQVLREINAETGKALDGAGGDPGPYQHLTGEE